MSGKQADGSAAELQNLWGSRLIYFDGGMGTMLQAMGLSGGEPPERWNVSHPARVKEVHLAYLAAGCDIVTANTFGATRAHLGEDAEACMRAGVTLAGEAVREAGHGFVAADMGSLGRLLAPYGDLPFEDAVSQFKDAFVVALAAGAQLLLIETMTELLEVKAVMIGAKEAMEAFGRTVPLFCSLTFDENGRLLTGADIRAASAMLASLGADAIGLNCGNAPRALAANLKALLRWCSLPVFVSPNASLPVVREGRTTFPTDPGDFAGGMRELAELGAWGLGGCCGTTPAHIAAMVEETKDFCPVEREFCEECVISGRSRSVSFGKRPLIIGERLNPTGKPRMKQALREGNMDFLLREAILQAEAGADVLDVNVGLPEIDEPAVLRAATLAIQTVCELPLQLDTADPVALEAALRCYLGKPLINSVSGKQPVMDSVFPLAKKYGGAIVALTLDERGIPETAPERIQIARRIIAEAEKHGIAKSDLIFDALTLTVATNENAARVTLETVRRLTGELGVKTILGVSNVSFGLPERPLLAAAFTAMAIESGLSAAIVNPLDATVRALWNAATAVSGRDAGFENYLGASGASPLFIENKQRQNDQRSESEEGTKASLATAEQQVEAAILRGLSADAASETRRLLNAGMEPLTLIERAIMPALAKVGEKFEIGTLFLPQLLQSASAAEAAFEIIRERVPEAAEDENRRVVLATVQGDVHDIGKNIVKVLLRNYGFAVTDLGRDVSPEAVLQAVLSTGASLVGLSALMTTTVPAMRETIALLKEEAPDTRVMVGGAVLTEEYAKALGADGYGKDAMAAVRLASRLLGAK